MFDHSLPLLRRVLSALLAAVFLLASPLGDLPGIVALPTPAAAVVVEEGAVGVEPLPLPRSWWAVPAIPQRQVDAVPVLSAVQAESLPIGDLDVVRIDAERVPLGRALAARNWAVSNGTLQWHPRPWLLTLGTLLAGFGLGTARWTTRSLSVLGLFGAGLALSIESLWLPAGLFVVLPAAWFVADTSYVVGMLTWAELWIASRPRVRPASAPTPLPVAHR